MSSSNAKSNTAMFFSVIGLIVSGSSALFTYRNSEATRQNAALQASQIETRMRLHAAMDPNAKDQPTLLIRLINDGAPVTIQQVGFELDAGPNLWSVWRPTSTDELLPKRLERNDSLEFRLGPKDIRSFEKDRRWGCKGLMAVTANDHYFRFNGDGVAEYLKSAQ